MQPPPPPLSQAFGLLQAGRPQEALDLFRTLAARDDPGALATLAQLYWAGHLVPQDWTLALDHFRRAGEAGHAASASYATNLLASGRAGHRDWPEAVRRLNREAIADPARARTAALLAALVLTDQGDPVVPPPGEMLSERPHVMRFPGAFTPAECAYLLAAEKPDFQRANIIDERTGAQRPDPIRTSEETTIPWLGEDPLLHAFNRRLAALSGTRMDQGEPLLILRYRPGQQYRPHGDYLAGAANQRIATALLYLNADYAGGETAFPAIGLKVKGRVGDVLLFRNVLPNGAIDKASEHAGLPVSNGEKYLATRWIRANAYQI